MKTIIDNRSKDVSCFYEYLSYLFKIRIEPAFHIPYLFSYAGRRDLTQEWVHQLVSARFSDTPGGLPGNDDLGSMSSWYIFSALGFYPLAPRKPVYTLAHYLIKW